MVAKPDYTLMNGLAHIVLPVANAVGDVITWPIRAIGDSAKWFHEMSNLRTENEELRARLDALLSTKYDCEVAIVENKKLQNEIDIRNATPHRTVIADVKFEDSVFHHNTFLINRGKKDGLNRGMVVVSFDNRLVGTVIDCGTEFCRVRAITDSNTNIAVRLVGTDISGFLQGNGKTDASIGFFSDNFFKPTVGQKIITSNISGILPAGIYVGEIKKNKNVDVLKPNQISRVMVLIYDNQDTYK